MIPVIKKYFLFISFFLSLFLSGQNFDAVVAEMAVEHEAEIIELRHWFHQNAELDYTSPPWQKKLQASN